MVPAAFAAVLFVVLGSTFVPLAGIQTDEALFATPLFAKPDASLLHRDIPTMVMSYLGTLKTFLYLPLFAIFGTGIWATRLPMLLTGAATICIFYGLVRKSQGAFAASLGALILATDPVFLLTHTFDWGPVALQIFLTVAGCTALYRFGIAKGHAGWLALGFFCFGLALWNKALFSWVLVGLVVGSLAYWRDTLANLSARNLLIAAGGFVLGAAPFIAFNVRHDFATLSENTHLAPETLGHKWVQVPNALMGRSLFAWVVQEEHAPMPKPAAAASEWIRQKLGQRRESIFYYVIAAMLAMAPLWWRSRAAWFAIAAFLAGWLTMALTKDAGGSAHHVILLWPLPVLFASVVLGRMWKALAIAVAVAVVAANLTVLHQYHYQFQRFGAGDTFTDALFPLSGALEPHRDKTIYMTDWGMFDSMNLAYEGRLQLRMVSAELSTDTPTEAGQKMIAYMLADTNGILVSHVRGREIFPNVGEHLEAAARAAGLKVEVEQTIHDSNGRPVFEIARVRPAGIPPADVP